MLDAMDRSQAHELPRSLGDPCLFSLDPGEHLHLDRGEALRYLGYTGQDIAPELMERIDLAIDEMENGARPRGVRAVFPIDASSLDGAGAPCIRLTGTTVVLRGRDIYRHLKDARWCALLACTLGMDNERRLRTLASQHPLEGAVFDAASSAAIEAAVERMDRAVRRAARDAGLSCNWRFSCGYGDCPLDVQPSILAAVDATRRCGISTTATDLLLPSKSVTAMIGIFEGAPHAADAPARCSICRMRTTCSLRSRGVTC